MMWVASDRSERWVIWMEEGEDVADDEEGEGDVEGPGVLVLELLAEPVIVAEGGGDEARWCGTRA